MHASAAVIRAPHLSIRHAIIIQFFQPQRHVINIEAIQTSLGTYFSYVQAFYINCIAMGASYWSNSASGISCRLAYI